MAIAYLIQESLPNISTQHPQFSPQSERLPDLAFLKFKGGSGAYVKAVETLLGEQVQQITHPYEQVISKVEGEECKEMSFDKYYEEFSDDEKCLCAQLVVTQMALYDFVKYQLTLNDIFIHKIVQETTVLDDKDTLCYFSFMLTFQEYKEAIVSVEFNDTNIKRLLSSTDPKSIALMINRKDDSLPTLELPIDIMFFGSGTTDRNVPTAGISNTA